MNGARCDQCKFGVLTGAQLSCRRYPPTVVMAPCFDKATRQPVGVQATVVLPGMMPNEWCGEFQTRIVTISNLSGINEQKIK